MSQGIKIAPSILSANFAELGAAVGAAEAGGADWIHVDVMDGHFVPNITIGPAVVAAIRPITRLPLDVHLMIENPERYIEAFANAGADLITVHVETCPHLHRTLQQIRDAGVRPGVTLNPATPASALEEVVGLVDMILVMTVNPGFGGQKFIAESLPKIARIRSMLDETGSTAELEVDGGVDPGTAPRVVAAGATVLVAGSAVFNSRATVADNIAAIRRALAEVRSPSR